MAKKIDLDDLDSLFDDPSFGGVDPVSAGRNPVSKVLHDSSTSIKSSLTDGGFVLERLIGKIIPKELKATTDKLLGGKDDLSREFHKNSKVLKNNIGLIAKDLDKSVSDTNVTTKRALGVLGRLDTSQTDTSESPAGSKDTYAIGELGNLLGKQNEASIGLQAQQTRLSYEGGALAGSMNTTLTKLLNYTTQITYGYQKKSLELKYRTVVSLENILKLQTATAEVRNTQNEAIIINTGLPEAVKLTKRERTGEMIRDAYVGSLTQGLLGNTNWVDKTISGLKKKMGGKLGEAGDMLAALRESGGGGVSAGEVVGGLATDSLLGKVGTAGGKLIYKLPGAGRLISKGADLGENAPDRMAEYLEDTENYEQESGFLKKHSIGMRRKLARFMLDMVGGEEGNPVVSESMVGSLSEPTTFDIRTKLSVETVIPGLLSRIHRELAHTRTGSQPKLVKYDYASRKFLDSQAIMDTSINSLKKGIVTSDSTNSLNEMVNTILPANATQATREALMDKLGKVAVSGKGLSEKSIRRTDIYKGKQGSIIRPFMEEYLDNHASQYEQTIKGVRGGLPDIKADIHKLMEQGYTEELLKSGLLKISDGDAVVDMDFYLKLVSRYKKTDSVLPDSDNPVKEPELTLEELKNKVPGKGKFKKWGKTALKAGAISVIPVAGPVLAAGYLANKGRKAGIGGKIKDKVLGGETIKKRVTGLLNKDLGGTSISELAKEVDQSMGLTDKFSSNKSKLTAHLKKLDDKYKVTGTLDDKLQISTRAKLAKSTLAEKVSVLKEKAKLVQTEQGFEDLKREYKIVAVVSSKLDTAIAKGKDFDYKKVYADVSGQIQGETPGKLNTVSRLLGNNFKMIKGQTHDTSRSVLAGLVDKLKGDAEAMDADGKSTLMTRYKILTTLKGKMDKSVKAGKSFSVGKEYTKLQLRLNMLPGSDKIQDNLNIVKANLGLLKTKVKTDVTSKLVVDLYLDTEFDPVILARDILGRKYIDAESGKVIEEVGDISGKVIDTQGHIVLTEADVFNGLKLKDGTIVVGEQALSLGVRNKVNMLHKAVSNLRTGTGSLLGKISFNDRDGDGDRDGNWKERLEGLNGKLPFKEREPDKVDKPDSKWSLSTIVSIGAGIITMLGSVVSLLGGVGSNLASGLLKGIAKTVGAGIATKAVLGGALGGALGKGKDYMKDRIRGGGAKTLKVGQSLEDYYESDNKRNSKTTKPKPGNAKVSKLLGKSVSKSLLKKVPFLGAVLGLGYGAQRFMGGDLSGGMLEVISGLASIVPGPGTGASVAIDTYLFAKDSGMGSEHEEDDEYGKEHNASRLPTHGTGKLAKGGLYSPVGGFSNVTVGAGETLTGMNPEMLKLLLGMANEYAAITGKKIYVSSGYRSYAAQADKYRRMPNKAAKPGTSMHEVGLAVDIPTITMDKLDKLGLSRKYGFTRPLSGEGWHAEMSGCQLDWVRAKTDSAYATRMILLSPGRGGGGNGSIKGLKGHNRNKELALKIFNAKPMANTVDNTTTQQQLTPAVKQAASSPEQVVTGSSRKSRRDAKNIAVAPDLYMPVEGSDPALSMSMHMPATATTEVYTPVVVSTLGVTNDILRQSLQVQSQILEALLTTNQSPSTPATPKVATPMPPAAISMARR